MLGVIASATLRSTQGQHSGGAFIRQAGCGALRRLVPGQAFLARRPERGRRSPPARGWSIDPLAGSRES